MGRMRFELVSPVCGCARSCALMPLRALRVPLQTLRAPAPARASRQACLPPVLMLPSPGGSHRGGDSVEPPLLPHIHPRIPAPPRFRR